jgi:hypothetical protein
MSLHSDIFSEGPDAWEFLRPLLYRQRNARNEAQKTVLLAWDALEMIHSDGFEILYERKVSFEVYEAAFMAVGMPEVIPVLERADRLLPAESRDGSEKFSSSLRAHFDELKQLAEEFWDKSADSDESLAEYIKAHRQDFAEYLGNTAGAD